MNEWGFSAQIKSWWDAEIGSHPYWAFYRCDVEHQVEGDSQRSDLVIIGGGIARLSGELRLPDHPLSSPWHPDNLNGAINKALSNGCRWCFTSDAQTLLLIDVYKAGPPQARVVQRYELVKFSDRRQLDSQAFLDRVGDEWRDVLPRLAPVILGQVGPTGMAVDEIFVNSLRALLDSPVAAIRDEINRRRVADPVFDTELVVWMVDEQGWDHLPERWEAEVLRTARLAAYVFVTRLVFYEALRRAQPSLPRLSLPRDDDATLASKIFKVYFAHAKERSGDYETVFAWDMAIDFALIADAAIPGWRRVVDHLAAFDLANLGYDVIGRLFERLIDPHERYHWGQHYTQPDIVDLMLSLAIPDGDSIIFDPAAGGGTFLVRAYARKKVFRPDKTHQDLLSEIYGLDISAFAASLATINLAVRSPEFTQNYPRVASRSFFRVAPSGAFMNLPAPRGAGLDGTVVEVAVDSARAIVCNPPYVAFQRLGEERRREAQAALSSPVGTRRVQLPSRIGGAHNYHLYFWFHAGQFLELGGRLVFITSGEWLDSDYGATLQKWLLDHFIIECCIESLAEPWFSDARVGTVVVSARRCDDSNVRESNLVRFVLLRQRLTELYGNTETEEERVSAVDALRERLLALGEGTGESDDFDWSVVRQAQLLELGLRGIGGEGSDD